MKFIVSTAVAAVLVLFSSHGSAEACRCAGPSKPTKLAVKRADVVVRGTIKKIEYAPAPAKPNKWYRPRPQRIELDVATVFKGTAHATTVIELGRTSCTLSNSHGKHIKVGTDWVMLAKFKRGKLFVRQCAGNSLASRAKAELARLGPGQKPLPGRAPPPKPAKP